MLGSFVILLLVDVDPIVGGVAFAFYLLVFQFLFTFLILATMMNTNPNQLHTVMRNNTEEDCRARMGNFDVIYFSFAAFKKEAEIEK